jgi:hypothetical protein
MCRHATPPQYRYRNQLTRDAECRDAENRLRTVFGLRAGMCVLVRLDALREGQRGEGGRAKRAFSCLGKCGTFMAPSGASKRLRRQTRVGDEKNTRYERVTSHYARVY